MERVARKAVLCSGEFPQFSKHLLLGELLTLQTRITRIEDQQSFAHFSNPIYKFFKILTLN